MLYFQSRAGGGNITTFTQNHGFQMSYVMNRFYFICLTSRHWMLHGTWSSVRVKGPCVLVNSGSHGSYPYLVLIGCRKEASTCWEIELLFNLFSPNNTGKFAILYLLLSLSVFLFSYLVKFHGRAYAIFMSSFL